MTDLPDGWVALEDWRRTQFKPLTEPTTDLDDHGRVDAWLSTHPQKSAAGVEGPSQSSRQASSGRTDAQPARVESPAAKQCRNWDDEPVDEPRGDWRCGDCPECVNAHTFKYACPGGTLCAICGIDHRATTAANPASTAPRTGGSSAESGAAVDGNDPSRPAS